MAVINWSDIVGSSTIADGGYVGDLLTLARAHVNDALIKNEITQAEAGQVYTAMIPAAFQNGIGFAMQDELTEKKIDGEVAKTALIERQTKGFDDDEFINTTVENPIDSIMKNAMDSLSIIKTNDPLGEV